MKEESGKEREKAKRAGKGAEWEERLNKLKELALSKMGLILLAGVLLFMLSGLFSGSKKAEDSVSAEKEPKDTGSFFNAEEGLSETEAEIMRYLERQEERLKAILEQVEGIGKVEVMFSVSSSREKVVLSDNPYSKRQVEETDSAGGTRKTKEIEQNDTTIYESNGGSQTPYVVKELEPELSGVLVLAEGAESDAVKAEIVEAVEALFGLPAHRIKVIKRRG